MNTIVFTMNQHQRSTNNIDFTMNTIVFDNELAPPQYKSY